MYRDQSEDIEPGGKYGFITSGRRRGVDGEVSVKWIPNQASHGFLPGQRTCGDDKVFAAGADAKRMAKRALADIFSAGRTSKMVFPVQTLIAAFEDEAAETLC